MGFSLQDTHLKTKNEVNIYFDYFFLTRFLLVEEYLLILDSDPT